MRTPVGHLTRKIRFICDEVDNWGGRILVTKFYDFANNKQFNGVTNLWGVEIVKYGKVDTEYAALHIENAAGN